VRVVDLRTLTVYATVQAGLDPRGIAVAPEGTVYVADQSGKVFILGAVQ
jgi:DNA-binding beta-propeller fold protein YncE